MRKERTVILSYPPASSIWHLPMGIGYLAAVLGNRGHHVVQNYGYIDGVEHVLRQRGGPRTDRALRTIRDPDSSILDRYAARMEFEQVSRDVSDFETFIVERNNVRCDSRHFKGGIEELAWVLRHRDQHVFYDYFVTEEVPRAVAARPDIFGISVSDERQLVSSCVLASLVKEALPATTVVLGGNYWARVMDAYQAPAFAPLFDHWDAIVYGEGFEPVVHLVEGEAPARVPGVVWRDRDLVRVNPPTPAPVDYETLPTPVFNRESRQWSPDFVPPLYTTSNCPMRCSFCSIAAGSDTFLQKPRVMSPARVVEHMVALGASRFDFVDEYLPITQQLKIGQELARIGRRATWQCYMIMNDKLLDPEVCAALAAAGCTGVQLGLESLDPEVLRQEAKNWNHPRNYGRILKNLHDAGIQIHVFIIVGVPNEPINWALRWLSFLEQYGEYILTIKSGRYRLTRRAPDEQRARQGALSGVEISAEDRLLLNLNRDQFRYTTGGLSRKRVEAVRDLLEQACHEHWAYQVTSTLPWWTNRGRHSLDEIRAMGRTLAAACPTEDPVPAGHLRRGMSKVGSAISEELDQRLELRDWDETRRVSRELLGDMVSDPR